MFIQKNNQSRKNLIIQIKNWVNASAFMPSSLFNGLDKLSDAKLEKLFLRVYRLRTLEKSLDSENKETLNILLKEFSNFEADIYSVAHLKVNEIKEARFESAESQAEKALLGLLKTH